MDEQMAKGMNGRMSSWIGFENLKPFQAQSVHQHTAIPFFFSRMLRCAVLIFLHTFSTDKSIDLSYNDRVIHHD